MALQAVVEISLLANLYIHTTKRTIGDTCLNGGGVGVPARPGAEVVLDPSGVHALGHLAAMCVALPRPLVAQPAGACEDQHVRGANG
ncbi:hypothetical protein E2C01_093181 [Portunus trituberculatus]|uniref:Uncharacterized protein n=1 Tax=Portunus trituberculatus TaxID=210409 RepID=A0A5B7JZV0_PORTR|nr:hypothetical protein [Portunus trituberculatus]